MISDFNHLNYESMTGIRLSAVELVKKIAKKKKLKDERDGLAVFEMINSGDHEAYDIFKEYCKNIAMLILNIQAVVDLTDFVIGGGISSQSILVQTINKEYDEMLGHLDIIESTLTRPRIVRAKFENNANLYGALYGLLQK